MLSPGPALDSVSFELCSALSTMALGRGAEAAWGLPAALHEVDTHSPHPPAVPRVLWLPWCLGDAHPWVSCQGLTAELIAPLTPEHGAWKTRVLPKTVLQPWQAGKRGTQGLAPPELGARARAPRGAQPRGSCKAPASAGFGLRGYPGTLCFPCLLCVTSRQAANPPAHCFAAAAARWCPNTACCQLPITLQHKTP